MRARAWPCPTPSDISAGRSPARAFELWPEAGRDTALRPSSAPKHCVFWALFARRLRAPNFSRDLARRPRHSRRRATIEPSPRTLRHRSGRSGGEGHAGTGASSGASRQKRRRAPELHGSPTAHASLMHETLRTPSLHYEGKHPFEPSTLPITHARPDFGTDPLSNRWKPIDPCLKNWQTKPPRSHTTRRPWSSDRRARNCAAMRFSVGGRRRNH